SKNIIYNIEIPQIPIFIMGTTALLDWVFENVIKNAIDAMNGKGTIGITLHNFNNLAVIEIMDTGKGIARKDFNRIFKPGYSSKTRGWGLGLSLSKRIIETYHKGKIDVKHSQVQKGTIMRIVLNTIKHEA
ncbi:MAG: ATP-binding protein, partial [Bacteroidia bacterium]